MSYGFDMCFWSARSYGIALQKAQAVVAAMGEKAQMENTIEGNLYYVPSLRNNVDPENWRMAMQADENWLYRLFSYRFVYWKEFRLLGMVGTLPDIAPKPSGCVYFQNSCDRDYELKSWPAKIPFFRERVKQARESLAAEPKECLKALYEKGSLDADVWEEIVEDDGFDRETAEYHTLSALYHDIFNTLQLHDWLWGKDNDVYQRFTFNAIHTIEQLYDLKRFLRKQVVAQAGDFATKEVVYVPLVLSTPENPSANTLLFKYTASKDELMTCKKARTILMEAAKKYLETEDGKRLVNAHGDDPNWLDLFAAIPASIFRRVGFKLVDRDNHSDAIVLDGEAPAEPEIG